MEYWSMIIAIISFLIGLAKCRAKLETILFNAIFNGHAKLERLALGARVANFSLIFKKFIELDLVDGKLDKMDLIEKYIKDISK